MTRPGRNLFDVPPADGCAAEYRWLYEPKHDNAAVARDRCELMWADFRDLADRDFVDRFPFAFHQRWFEMYLGAALRRAGLKVTASKPGGPDLQVIVDGRQIWIEAIAPIAGHPLHADTVQEPVYWDSEGNPVAARVPHDQITLRLVGAFKAKGGVFNQYLLDGRVAKDHACIIAINLRAIPHAWADAEEFWFRALYGVGERFVAIDRAGGATMAGRNHRTLLHHTGGAPEDVAPLLSPEYAHICGVLGSSADAANVPNPLGDDFVLMPHAAAPAPYPSAFIKRGTEVLLHADRDQRWTVENIDHGAQERRGPERVFAEVGSETVEGQWAVEGRTLSVRVGKRGCDIRLAGGDDAAAVARDVVVEIVRAERSREAHGGS